MTKIKPTEFSYIAGYLDGDGCFYIGEEKNKKRLSIKHVVSIVVTSVNRAVLDYFKSRFGGSVCLIGKETRNSKALYQFSIKKRNVIKIAENILPFLVEKKEECQLAVKFASSKDTNAQENYIKKIRILKDVGNLVSKYHKEEFEQTRDTITPSENDFAYLAGFIDAECNLGIQKYKPKGKPNHVYKIILQCNNTKAPVFKWILERFGGQIHFIDRLNYQKGRKNQLTWRLSGKSLSAILEKIHPFLRHKKPVCEELMKFSKLILPNGGARHTETFRKSYSKILEERENIVTKVHLLNLKGIKKHLGG